jgi:hypothetical protein
MKSLAGWPRGALSLQSALRRSLVANGVMAAGQALDVIEKALAARPDANIEVRESFPYTIITIRMHSRDQARFCLLGH